jgi:hypothetical protein
LESTWIIHPTKIDQLPHEKEDTMKRALILLVSMGICFVMLAVAPAFADKDQDEKMRKFYTIRVSYYEPRDAVDGFAVGGSWNGRITDVLSLGVGTDIFVRNFVRDTPVATQEYASGINTTTVQREVQYSTVIFPIQMELSFEIPIVKRLTVFGQGAFGWELLWVSEQNWVDSVSDSRLYTGATYTGAAGLMFKLGQNSDLYLQGYYKHSKVKRERDVITAGLPAFEEVNLSGLGLRMGLAFEM